MTFAIDAGSFRDPSGFVFRSNGVLYRQVQACYQDEFTALMDSGLYAELSSAGLLVAHTEESLSLAVAPDAWRILRPEPIPFISYPYEWCFSQLKDAALTTLQIQKRALERGLSLKDASAYNIQFRDGKPVFIDTLSFERYHEGKPWVAYRQFCQHFLAPLALMGYTDVRLGQLLRTYLDGIPLDLASKLLPGSTKLKPGILTHIHLHGAAQRKYQESSAQATARQAHISKLALQGLLDSLEGVVSGLTWVPSGTTWADYYANTNYSDGAMDAKKAIVAQMLGQIAPAPATAWDLGANNGLFSRLAASLAAQTVAWDIDPAAVEQNYLQIRKNNEKLLLPLLVDLTNPTPGIGWALAERSSMLERAPADVAFALALVHHLAIANNVPLAQIAQLFARIASWLIIEFVPKSDSQVQRLLAAREDIFSSYHEAGFESAFATHFEVTLKTPVPSSERTLYLMKRRATPRG